MICVENASVGYGRIRVLNQITFQVAPGELVAVLGKNGCGKTTLLRLLTGRLRPQGGTVELKGKAPYRMPPRLRGRTVALLPQRPPVVPKVCAAEFVLLGRYPHCPAFAPFRRQDHEAAWTALEQVGAVDLATRPVSTLSVGELSRVLLAQVLAQDTPIVLLDEPAAHLDPAWAASVFAILENLRDQGKTILVVAHDLNLAALHCSRFLALEDGRLVFDGLPHDFCTPKKLSQIYATPLVVVPHPLCAVPQTLPLPCPAQPGPSREPAPGHCPPRRDC
jgi:iron complex transport system ATP-binding protein